MDIEPIVYTTEDVMKLLCIKVDAARKIMREAKAFCGDTLGIKGRIAKDDLHKLLDYRKKESQTTSYKRTQTVQNQRRPSKSLGIKANGGTVRQGR